MLPRFLKNCWMLLTLAGKGFLEDKAPKLSASLAYYTLFSLGPLLILVIYFAGLFWGREAIAGRINNELAGIVGQHAAQQIQQIVESAAIEGDSTLTVILGSITLVVGATTVFAEMQDSINMIWKLKAKPKKGLIKMLITRLLSFSLVISLGFLLLVSLVINALMSGLMEALQRRFPETTVVLLYILNIAVTATVIGFLFAIIFKVLPDAKIRWRDVLVGALFTTILFMLGRFGISYYIGRQDVGSSYGAAGSLVILLLWIYFSAFILYFGAEFTRAYAIKFGAEIRPNQYAVTVQTLQVESNQENIQENEKGRHSGKTIRVDE